MAESKLVLPKPKMIVKMVLGDSQSMDVKTDRYTLEELEQILDRPGDAPIRLWGADENDTPVRVVIHQPKKIVAYVVLDFESFKKTMLQAQYNAARQQSGVVRS